MAEIPLNKLIKLPHSIRSFAVAVRKDKRDPVDSIGLYSNDAVSFHEKYFKTGSLSDRRNEFGMCFLEIAQDVWLLTKVMRWSKGRVCEKYCEYAGRLAVHFHKTNRAGDIDLNAQIGRMTVHSILESQLGTSKFKGYYETRISFQELQNVVKRNLTDWRDALQSVFAVYLISDRNGGAYVGSATGKNGLWGRWSAYATGNFEGHADDVWVKERIGGDQTYPNNFEFSILEVFDMKRSRREIVNREEWWKDTLRTRRGQNNEGMNGN